MRKSVAGLAVLTALAALALNFPPGPSVAQQGPTQSSQSIAPDRLFAGPESVDMRAGHGAGTSWLVDFVKKAQASGSQCALDVNVTVMFGPKDAKDLQNRTYDPLFSEALAAARRDVLTGILKGFGPSVRVTANITKGLTNMVTVDARSAQDKEAPKLEIDSKPRKGTKVHPGQQIVVTMTARDDANRWQSGIKTVTLVADSEGDRLVAGPTYPPSTGCKATPAARDVRATYTVPADPPPVVRLTATAMDHAGLTGADVIEFPTGDWHGTLEMLNPNEGSQQTRTRAEFVLNHDGKGNLTGAMTGEQELVPSSRSGCSFKTNQPNRFRMVLVGSHTEKGSPKVLINDVQETKLKVGVQCEATPPQEYEASIRTYLHIPYFLGTPSPMGDGELLSDGSRRYRMPDNVTTMNLTVRLRRARN